MTITEIADAQKADKHLRKLFKRGGENNEMQYQVSLVEDTEVLTNSQLRLVLPPSLQKRAIQWYHHYLTALDLSWFSVIHGVFISLIARDWKNTTHKLPYISEKLPRESTDGIEPQK